MFFWRGLTIRNKFRFLNASWFLMMIMVGYTGLWAVDRVRDLLADQAASGGLIRTSMESDRHITSLRHHAYQAIVVAQNQPDTLKKIKQNLKLDAELLEHKLVDLKNSALSPSISALVSQIEPDILSYRQGLDKLINELMQQGKFEPNDLQVVDKLHDKLSANLLEIAKLQHQEMQATESNSEQVFWFSAISVALVILIATLMVYLALRSLSGIIVRAMVRSAHVAERISEGDLSETIQRRNFYRRGNEELQTLINSMDKMQRSLTDLVLEVRENANGVAIASSEIAAGNNDLSQRTDKQAKSIQDTTASVGEFKDMIQATANSAREASGLADKASQIAECGGQVVGQVVSTMQNITSSSKKIGDIVGAIDSIAFQTNILALNAAVEASRAGEQGKGFAVVAAEVRQLAMRSASAAREISDIVQSSVHEIDTGSKLVDEAGTTMQEIVVAVTSVTTMINDICQQSTHQASTVADVTEAIVEIDNNTQQNVTLVQESAAAAVLLKENADKLTQAVAAFRF